MLVRGVLSIKTECGLAWFISDSEHVTLETAQTTWVFMHWTTVQTLMENMITIVSTHDKLYRILNLNTLHGTCCQMNLLFQILIADGSVLEVGVYGGQRGSVCFAHPLAVGSSHLTHNADLKEERVKHWLVLPLQFVPATVLLGCFPGQLVEISTHGKLHNIT